MSGTQSSESGGQKITADVVMSGGYEVAPNGKLLRPKDPSVVLPPLPDAATEFSEEGAYAFSEYWLDTLAYAWNSGDAHALAEISDESCTFCGEWVLKIQKTEERGNWVSGIGYEKKRLNEIVQASENLYGLTLEVKTHEHTYYVEGEIVQKPAKTHKLEFQPCWKKDHWMMCGGLVY